MNEIEIQVPTYYIHQIGEQLAICDVNVKNWLTLSNVKESDIGRSGKFISLKQFKTLINSAIQLSKRADLGLLVGKSLGITTHGMLGYAMIASSNLRETIELFSRYLNTRTPLIRVEQINNKETLKVVLHECYPLDSIKIPFMESAIFTLYNLLMQVAQNAPPIQEICFPFLKPSYHQQYSKLFDFPVRFGCTVASLTLSQQELDKPLKMSDPISLEQAKSICDQELEKLQNDELLGSRVRKHLLSFKNKFPCLISVSNHFNFSQRTFHRKLKKEGTSFSTILKSVRNFRSIQLLNKQTLTVQEVSFLLGYSDVANFRKAFKQWQGVSPSDFRKSDNQS